MSVIIFGLLAILSLRTASANLQLWQRFNYRWDRLWDYFSQTDLGQKQLRSLCFFPGIFPRPKITSRILLIAFLHLAFSSFVIYLSLNIPFLTNQIWLDTLLLGVLFERTLFLQSFIAVKISDFPVFIQKKRLYSQAKSIINQSRVQRIGIAGSFGKSSTKEIIVHLFREIFGHENVFYNPANYNEETSIARRIIKQKKWFSENSAQKKFAILEVGAYKQGEIKTVVDFYQPHVAVMTPLNHQHISTFGSVANIQAAKFEMAEAAKDTSYYAADNTLQKQVHDENQIQAQKIPVWLSEISNIQELPDASIFDYKGQTFTLPWGGTFFIQNALLAIKTAEHYGISLTQIQNALGSLPPLDRALRVEKWQQTNLLIDLYAANENGVHSAIEHLSRYKGQKIICFMPLRELGEKAQEIHEQIFNTLKQKQVIVFYFGTEFSFLGEQIMEDLWCGQNVEKLKKIVQNLGSKDAVLLESRLPETVTKIFNLQSPKPA